MSLRSALLSDPTTNGITVFVLGILFILSVYHFSLYLQNKRPAYLLYSAYTLLIFGRHCFLSQGDVFDSMLASYRPVFVESGLKDFVVWIYNCVYFLFIYHFLDLGLKRRPLFRFIRTAAYAIGGFGILIQLATFLLDDREIMTIGYTYFFLPVITVCALLGMYIITISKSPVRYYALFGSIALLISSLITTGVFGEVTLDIGKAEHFKFNIFYLGVVLENFLFALGLGHKHRIIQRERDESQRVLIDKYEENESLKEELKTKLEDQVRTLSMEGEQKELQRLKADFEKQLTELRISSLRNQMNPHFIFNSLNSIKLYIIKEDTENAVYYLNKFSKLIRRILDTTKETDITLEKELETAELYMNIENIRFDNQIEFGLTIHPDVGTSSIRVPPLILQPFIENSIWHGLAMKEGEKHLLIEVGRTTDGLVTITIEDNGVGRAKAQEAKKHQLLKKDSIGLGLTQERMERFAEEVGGRFDMSIEDLGTDDSPLGTRVVLTLSTHSPTDNRDIRPSENRGKDYKVKR